MVSSRELLQVATPSQSAVVSSAAVEVVPTSVGVLIPAAAATLLPGTAVEVVDAVDTAEPRQRCGWAVGRLV
jgi:hypothetical protein